MTRASITFLIWDENLDGIREEFPEDWATNKSALINEMIDYCLQNGFRVSKPLLRVMKESIEQLQEDVKVLRIFCHLQEESK